MFVWAKEAIADRPLASLEEEICELSAQISAGMARWLELVAEFDRREGWANTGCVCCAAWVAWRCGIDERTAREHVRVARAMAALPLVTEAFATGRLSYAKVRALSRVATPDTEAELMPLAEDATAAQLERMLSAYRRVTTDEANEANQHRHLSYFWAEDGSLCFSGRLPAEEGALLLEAVSAAEEALREQAWQEAQEIEASGGGCGSAEPRADADGSAEPQPLSRADALVCVAETALARGPTELAAPDRHQLVVHIDAEALGRGDGACVLENGPAIAPETARRLGCDATLVAIIEGESGPLSVGRRTRAIPTGIRRALQARDRTCRFPGCSRHRFTDAHHIHHWADGGETSLENLILLCRHHHRLLHEGGYRIELSAGGEPRFFTAHGKRIAASPPLPAAKPADLARRNRAAGLSIDAGTARNGIGERMNLALCVDAVVQINDP